MVNIKIGEVIPQGTFNYIPYGPELEDQAVCGVPITLSTNEWRGKKVVLFSVHGAFTPTCHLKHLPGFLEKYPKFKSRGVDVVAVLSANDPFVMSAWGRVEGVKNKILTLSDPSARWSTLLGLSMTIDEFDLGLRTVRYAIIIDNLVVKYIGINSGPSLSVSGADAVLSHL